MRKWIIALALVLMFGVGVAYATSMLPDEVEQFYDDCGHVCYVWPDGSGDCYPCEECVLAIVEMPVPIVPKEPTEDPTNEPTPVPPTETPVPPTEEPTKEACNRGLGNGSEDCDPGNSGGKPGAAGEDNE